MTRSSVFGRYKVVEEIGRGAMGVVYRATDPLIGRPVALKVINEKYLASVGVEPDEYFERFRREAEVAGRLNHPGIVKIFDLGPNYLVMELLDGQTLQTLLRTAPRPSLPDAIDTIRQIAAALDHAHAQGIVHRDIKPANVMMVAGGAVKVMDFGLARIDSSTLTAAGEILGSASYMAPEVVTGQPVSPRSDIFSLGVVAYELMTGGQRPFGGTSISQIIHALLERTPPSVRSLNLELPAAYDGVFAQVLAKSPASRFDTAGAFARALEVRKGIEDEPTLFDGPAADAPTVLLDKAALAAPSPPVAPSDEPTVLMDQPPDLQPSPDAPTVLFPASEIPPPQTRAPAQGKRLVVGLAVGCGILLLAALVVGTFVLVRLLGGRA
jgi:serine/threonine-protein kinase